MNVGAPQAAGESAVGPRSGGAGSGSQRDTAGLALRYLSVLPALLVMSWLLAGFLLLLAGHFTPVLTFVFALVVAAVLVPLGLRLVSRVTPEPQGTPWWAVAAVVAIAVAFLGDQIAYHSQFIIVMRDPASYFQFAEWISRHGSLPVPQDRAAFGGAATSGYTFNSFAFYQVGHTIVPQFMAGLPMVLSGALWLGGAHLALLAAPALGTLALLAFGGLVARLVGPAWAPLAVLVLAVSLPEQFTSRSNYSEPLAEILFLSGLCLVIDSLGRIRGDRLLAAIGGLALGLTVLVRIDGASDILPVVPYCGLLFLGRRRQALPLFAGAAVGVAYGAVDGIWLTRPYLAANKSSVIPLALLGVLVLAATAAAMPVLWKRGVPQVRSKWLINAASALPVLIICAFAIRPYVHQARAAQSKATKEVIAAYQRANHQPVSPTRTYAEISLHWVFWYVGIPVVVLATLAAVLLTRRCLRGQVPLWTLPLITFAWAITEFLYRPAITPDHPWASRRLVPTVLPGFILLATWGTSWLTCWLREHGYAGVPSTAALAVLALAMVLPATKTTFGLGVKTGGPAGVTLVADGLWNKTTYWGELGAVENMCSDIPRNSSVLIISGPIADRFEQIVRGMCGAPAVRLTPHGRTPSATVVKQAIAGIRQAGRTPVLLGAKASELNPYAGPVKQVMNLHTQMDTSTLVTPPTTTKPLHLSVWMSEPAS